MGYTFPKDIDAQVRKALPEISPASSKSSKAPLHSTQENLTSLRIFKANEGAGRIHASVLSVANAHAHGELYGDFLRARKHVFIDTKSWDLPQTDGMEFDQYDTPQSRSIVLHEYGEILAGIRILPTKARCGCYSYMLRDAQLGVINTIPQHVLYERAPTADYVWEATRLFVSSNVPAKRRMMVQSLLMVEMAKAAVDEGASHVVGIVPYVFKRWLERLGMGALPLGPKITMDGDTSQAAIMHVAGI
ncbi:acyl-homoserine-lactone synthase [Litoreibacter albidus]|uniref:Autoinducer synthase n=1 Tax=Litoreibacter albidus TaxID=670155 RepID=A0A1H3BG71_9RHOB|nr:acyl-homoserine-lactone synthase [Litoreibacter albidus]SDX40933.1 Autoinducer synthase [Litoreibacter albidus]